MLQSLWSGKVVARSGLVGIDLARASLWLANCYFAHNSLGFSALLPFFNASSRRPFHPDPVAPTWRRPFPRCRVLLLKHQLLIVNRTRQRSPMLSSWDRILAGWMRLMVRPTRLLRSAPLSLANWQFASDRQESFEPRLVDLDVERQGDLLGNSQTAPVGITLLFSTVTEPRIAQEALLRSAPCRATRCNSTMAVDVGSSRAH